MFDKILKQLADLAVRALVAYLKDRVEELEDEADELGREVEHEEAAQMKLPAEEAIQREHRIKRKRERRDKTRGAADSLRQTAAVLKKGGEVC